MANRGNARKQSFAELRERRRQVIQLYRKSYKITRIVDLTGLSWPAGRGVIDLYEGLGRHGGALGHAASAVAKGADLPAELGAARSGG